MKKKWIILIGFLVITLIGILWRCTPKAITEDKAISISKSILTDAEKNTITNYDTPQIEIKTFDEEPYIYKYKDTLMLADREIYMITYTTKVDGFLGPIIIYVDKKSGTIYGRNFRL